MPPTTSSSSKADEQALRAALVAVMQRLERDGLNRAAAGNASVRCGEDLLITPSGVLPDELRASMIVPLARDGRPRDAHHQPSSEWRFHVGIYAARPEAGAIVHVHAPYATALACTRREIPPFHYMVAVAGGANIRCAPYATFGTAALSDAVLAGLEGRRACLLANHGLVALGADLPRALKLTMEVEELAKQYLLALGAGGPVLLSATEIAEALKQFETYGQQQAH